MPDEPVLFETEAGLVLLQGTKILAAERKSQVRAQGIAKIGERARAEGMESIKAMDAEASRELGKLGFSVTVLTEVELNELNTRKISIIVSAGLAPGEQEALDIVRQAALEAAEQKISSESSREDLQLVHAIQGLDELDRMLNITAERVAEWYSLHFPELLQMLGDNILLSKIIVENG